MKQRAEFKGSRASRGFTLIEIAVALAIMALIAAATVPNFMEEIRERQAAVTVQETQTIMDAARSYRVANGAWPGGATCATAWNVLTAGANPYMGGLSATNKYNYPYTLSCQSNTFRISQRTAQDWDSFVANQLPGTTITNSANNTITTVVGVPGSEPAMDSKLSRLNVGNPELNRMKTAFYMGGNAIHEGGDINLSKANPVITAQSGSLRLHSASGQTILNGTLQVQDVMLGATGRLLSSSLPNYVHKGTYIVRHGWLVAKPGCPNSGQPKASLRPGNLNAGMTASPGIVAYEYRTIDSGSYWTVSTNTYGAESDRNNMDSLIDVYCYYP
jgi:prepilin-type N-terminal cleavage/methylation domain-containing protein